MYYFLTIFVSILAENLGIYNIKYRYSSKIPN